MRNVKKRLFIDFDGTLISVKHKYYELYKNAKQKFNLNIFDLNSYWEYKKNRYSEKNICLLNNNNIPSIEGYLIFRKNNIENRSYLAYDKTIINKKLLENVALKYDLYLATMRVKKENLIWQLKKMDLYNCFTDIRCREDLAKKKLSNNAIKQKQELLNKYTPFFDYDILIGDTELDYLAGQNHGLNTFIVNNGIRSEKLLLKLCLDIKKNLRADINSILYEIS